ncbi:VWA domain-containing protein [Kovacikia minuta CCNUW1]|uniref:VWA domain-containing protein n=1 Tax=Kovacikia minuta TaxID=2931930 RepID=UPI001CCF6BEA|nr:VWA domain-containing protein [Kovacikia minuta]UBF27609.1 VWA domain-containing protein [Kovacikia minuta CCNUW1]
MLEEAWFSRHFYYVGRGEQDYATIIDFTPSSQSTESDSIQLHGRSQDYSLEVVNGDTKIYRDSALLDLFLLQDLSDSFRNDLPIIRGLLPNLVTEVRGIQSNSWFGVGSFDGYDGYTYRTEQAMNNNTNNELQTTYANLGIGGGGIESQLESLLRVAARGRTSEVGFRTDSTQIVVLITDETYQQTVSNLPTIAQVRDALSSAGIIPVFLVTSAVQGDYTTLANQLNGEVATISTDSSNLIAAIREGLINAGAGRELIAVVKGHTDLSLTADYFSYVTT